MKNMKRLLAVMLALVLVCGVLPMTTHAAESENPYNGNVHFGYVIGGETPILLDRNDRYLSVNAGTPTVHRTEPDNWCAYYNRETGVLTLKDYNGPQIRLDTVSGDFTVKLIGTNVINSPTSIGNRNYGIQKTNSSGAFIITADEAATLTINVTGSEGQVAHGIDMNIQGWKDCSFTLGGKAHLIVNAQAVTADYSNGAVGIYASAVPVTIQDDASYTARIENAASCASVPTSRCGIFTGVTPILIDTTGSIDMDCSQHVADNDKSAGFSGNILTVKKVGGFVVKTTPDEFSNLKNSDAYWPNANYLDMDAYWFETYVTETEKIYTITERIPGSQYKVFLEEPADLAISVGATATMKMAMDKDLIVSNGYATIFLQEQTGEDTWDTVYPLSSGGYGGSLKLIKSDTEATKTYRWQVSTTTAGKQESKPFTVTWAYGQFTKQPKGGSSEAGQPFKVEFAANITDRYIVVEKYDASKDTWAMQGRFASTETTYTIPYGTPFVTDRYRLYIDKGGIDGATVYSDEFEITWGADIFKTQPTGGRVLRNDKFMVSFAVKDYAEGATLLLQRKYEDHWYDMGAIKPNDQIDGSPVINTVTYRVVCTYKGNTYYSDEFKVIWEDGGWIRIPTSELVLTPNRIEAGTVLTINEEVIETNQDIYDGYLEGNINWIYTESDGNVHILRPKDLSSLTITENMLGGKVYCIVYGLNDIYAFVSSVISLTETDEAVLLGYSLSLTDQIGVNFHIALPEDVLADDGAYLEFTVPGAEKQTVAVADSDVRTVDDKECYVFRCEVAPKQIMDTITARVMTSDGECSGEYEFAVWDYIQYIYDNEEAYDADTLALVRAINLYGYYAQKYFNYHTDNLADIEQADAATLSDNMLETLGISFTATSLDTVGDTLASMGIDVYGHSLILASQVKLRMYFGMSDKLAAGLSNNAIVDTATGAAYALKKYQDGIYYIESDAYLANEGMKPLQITIKVDGKTVTITSYTYQYCKDALLNKATDTALKNLVNAYVYYTYTANLVKPYKP